MNKTQSVVMIRMSQPLHAALKTLAHQHEKSTNELLIGMIDCAVHNNPGSVMTYKRERDRAKAGK